MASETLIENNLIRNRERILGVRDSLFIRRTRIGPGFGVADLIILPQRGPKKLIIVEAKRSSSPDAKIKVVGQLLMYYAGVLELGSRGIRLMRSFAVEQPRETRSRNKVSLKAWAGGITPPALAWAEVCKGRRLRPDQVGLVAALDSRPGETLTSVLSVLKQEHGLEISVVSVLGRDNLELWRPS
jgi:hypothetical protein